jgi:hypothetical protein
MITITHCQLAVQTEDLHGRAKTDTVFAGQSAITEIHNKEEFSWHLQLHPVKWMV